MARFSWGGLSRRQRGERTASADQQLLGASQNNRARSRISHSFLDISAHVGGPIQTGPTEGNCFCIVHRPTDAMSHNRVQSIWPLRDGICGPISAIEGLARASASPTWSGPEGSSHNEPHLGRCPTSHLPRKCFCIFAQNDRAKATLLRNRSIG